MPPSKPNGTIGLFYLSRYLDHLFIILICHSMQKCWIELYMVPCINGVRTEFAADLVLVFGDRASAAPCLWLLPLVYFIFWFKKYKVVYVCWDRLLHYHYLCKNVFYDSYFMDLGIYENKPCCFIRSILKLGYCLKLHPCTLEVFLILSVSHRMGLAVSVVIHTLYVIIFDKSIQLFFLLKYMH